MRAITLLYHDVVSAGHLDDSGFRGAAANRYKIDREVFQEHLAAVASVVPGSPGSVVDWLAQEQGGPPPVFLTFDDGGAGALAAAAALDPRGWKGHVFVTTDYIGRPGFLSAAQIRDLHARGHVIGTHSCSHPACIDRCPWPQLLQEWQRSAEMLAAIIGQPTRTASVPGGAYSKNVARAAAQTGIRALFTSEPTDKCRVCEGCTVFGRYAVRRGTSARTAAAFAEGRTLVCLGQRLAWACKKVLKVMARPIYYRLYRHYATRG